MINRASINSQFRVFIFLSTCLMTAMSLSYFSLDMRTPKKCTALEYTGTMLDVVYEVFDPNKDQLSAGVRTPNSILAQSAIIMEIFPPNDSTIKRTKVNHVTQELTDLEGKISYATDGRGEIHICTTIQELPGRKYPRPTLIGVRVKESGFMEDSVPPPPKADEKGQIMAKRHLSDSERILTTMIKTTNALLQNADSIKDEESGFHQKSVDMNSASKWWPMMHVVVLLVTGFTQANHVIKFFKSRHII
mmetsp:Transcript_24962/g.30685  ORF Transcript_24962/g.30685 Transcript_24962/m.30685 type:complete len:248 (-) Transcript_24962:740-1483(-)